MLKGEYDHFRSNVLRMVGNTYMDTSHTVRDFLAELALESIPSFA